MPSRPPWAPYKDNKDRNREAIDEVIRLKEQYHFPVVAMGKSHAFIGYYFNRMAPGFEFMDFGQTPADDRLVAQIQKLSDGDVIFFSYTITQSKDQTEALSKAYDIIEKHHFPRDNYVFVLKKHKAHVNNDIIGK